MEHNEVVRYSDADLEEFRILIETKLERAEKHLAELQEQILEITENTSDEHGGDWVDDSSINNDVEMLNNMAIRQRMHIQDLDNALVRIKNKSYGICSITGQLIDKRRLLAVPTTTKSLAAKVAEQAAPPIDKKEKPEPPVQEEKKPAPQEKPGTTKRIITTVIRKSSSAKKKPQVDLEDFEEEEDDINLRKEMYFEEDQELLYGSASDIEDLMEDQGTAGPSEMMDDEIEEDY
ncbi:MAG: TraR/DksA family transcriptional regulator [Haliscomenobacter sp.]|nr:TraR/DksA family transcriptional regulator [Haliscomenobacter sp.]MBP9077070.1 TraR/DksA family transcriptional regulator [Haliscomenobacter sp.]MBP9872815.1 TraR/DksA family transcriptional regulator [Haliscomenobacter sp.]